MELINYRFKEMRMIFVCLVPEFIQQINDRPTQAFLAAKDFFYW